MKIVSIVGARPQFIKLAPVARALEARGAEHIVIHTGQHYDEGMSDSIFSDLNIKAADYNLEVGSASHGAQTGRMLQLIEDKLSSIAPDRVLVYGDTNSTVAGSLAAVKLHFYVAHLEAGLRSNNRRMPEEINRVATDHISDLCLAPTAAAMSILAEEGLSSRAILVGDVMADVCLSTLASVAVRPPDLPFEDGVSYGIATIHRAENTDDPHRLFDIISQLSALSAPVVIPAHPRLAAKAFEHGISLERENLVLVPPLNYSQMVYAVSRADFLVTDSGGLQKEAMVIGTPCTTVRPETEWPETQENGMNILVEPRDIVSTVDRKPPIPPVSAPFGRGDAAERVADVLLA